MTLTHALQNAPVVLDGGLATTLEAAGHDLSTALWSARLLLDDPAAIVAAHLDFLDAGAQVLITASYQASVDGFVRAGWSPADAGTAMRRSVEVAREAIRVWRGRTRSAEQRWVAGSVGPYGATLADGSEYTGAYGLTDGELRAFHAPRIDHLVAAGADVLAIETQPRLDEALVALAHATNAGIDAWVSFTTQDGRVLPDGTPIDQAAAAAADAGAVAVGVNCCAPAAAEHALELLGGHAPTVAYPNLGDRWDPDRRTWVPRDPSVELPLLQADLVGGCCGTSPRHLFGLVQRIRS